MNSFTIETATSDTYARVGELMVKAYSQLKGFPKPDEMPAYYNFLRNVGELTATAGTEIFIAKDNKSQEVIGAVLFLNDVSHYGVEIDVKNPEEVAAFRLLAADPLSQGRGIGRALVMKCIARTKELGKLRLIIHSTDLMIKARHMYNDLGFIRYPQIDFNRNNIDVYGFELKV